MRADAGYRDAEGKAYDAWKMTASAKTEYEKDANIKHIRIDFSPNKWEW